LTPDHEKSKIDPIPLDEGYNFALDFIPIGGMQKKLLSRKATRVPTLAISIWMRASQKGAKYTIWGKVVASLKSRP
jgi:hypothetical protein